MSGPAHSTLRLSFPEPPVPANHANGTLPPLPARDEEIVEALLQAGASADSPNPDFNFPLHLAASRGKLSLLKLLLEVRRNVVGDVS